MTDNVFYLPQEKVIISEDVWPSFSSNMSEMCKARVLGGHQQKCPAFTDVIALMGTAYELFQSDILTFTLERTEEGFLISTSKTDPEAIQPSTCNFPYAIQDVEPIFSGWPIGYKAVIHCSPSGSIFHSQGIQFSWMDIDWQQREKEMMEKYGLS